MNNVIYLQRTEETCGHANVIARGASLLVNFFFLLPFFPISMVNGAHKCPTNGRPFRVCSEYFCFHPLFFFPRPSVSRTSTQRKLMFALSVPIRLGTARARGDGRKNAMTGDDPGVIFNFESMRDRGRFRFNRKQPWPAIYNKILLLSDNDGTLCSRA